MNPKPKIVLSSNRYRFAHLLRHFTNAVAFAKAGEYLQPPDLFRTMDSLGYLSQEKCEKDYELVNSIIYLLAFPRGQGLVSQRNLFRFLMTVSDVHGNADAHFQTQIQALPTDSPQLQDPLVKLQVGSFSQEGIWTPSQSDETQIRKIFGQMVYTRVSRQDIEANRRKQQQAEEEQFQPKILVKSTALAQSRFKKLGVEGRVEDRLLQGKNLYESRREEGLRQSIERQLKECSFKPRTNSYKINKQNSFSINKGESLMLKGKQYELRRKLHTAMQEQEKIKIDFSECSFKPDLSLSRSSLRQSVRRQVQPYVRNQDKSVTRVRVARQQREGLNEVNKRGYPAGVLWVEFMQEVKRKRSNNHTTSLFMENKIILSIDLKILGQKRHLQVRQGDDTQEIAQRICQQSNLNDSCFEKILSMVVHSISQCPEIIIRQNHVYLKSQ